MNCSSSVVFLSLGTNIGIKSNNLEQAIEQLKKYPKQSFCKFQNFIKLPPGVKQTNPIF